MHLIIDMTDDTDLSPVVFARNARREQGMMGRVKRERWSSVCLTFLLPITPHTPLERDSERWLETSQVMILYWTTVGGWMDLGMCIWHPHRFLRDKWHYHQFAKGIVCFTAVLSVFTQCSLPTNGCWEPNHIPLEKSPYRKLGANTFQKMEAEMLHALHKTFIVITT